MTGEAAHHVGRVLRAEPGQLYELSDGSTVRLGKIEFAGKDRIEFSLLESIAARTSSLEKTVLLAVVKFDAFEWALEKATELGVNRIVPLAAARCEKGLLAAAGKRAERWRKIVFEAAQQSRRVRLPLMEELASPAVAFQRETMPFKVMLSEKADAPPLRHLLQDSAAEQVALAVGPEGGWTEGEFASARKAGFAEASLGTLILRAETAAIAGLAAVNYALEA